MCPQLYFAKYPQPKTLLGRGKVMKRLGRHKTAVKKREEQLRAFDSLSLTVNPRAIRYSLKLRLLTKNRFSHSSHFFSYMQRTNDQRRQKQGSAAACMHPKLQYWNARWLWKRQGVRNVHGIIAVPPISWYLPSPLVGKTEAAKKEV